MLRRPLRSTSSVGEENDTANTNGNYSLTNSSGGTGAGSSKGLDSRTQANITSCATSISSSSSSTPQVNYQRSHSLRKLPGGDPKRLLLQCLLCLPCLGLCLMHFCFFLQPSSTTSIPSLSSPTPSDSSQSAPLLTTQVIRHQSPTTLVTAFFPIKSKHSEDSYKDWMSTMLSLQDPMVIYTTPDMRDELWKLRRHAWNRTLLVEMELKELPVIKERSMVFWHSQLNRDPERRLHKTFELFWVWLSKPWFIKDAIARDPFQSEYFVWSDIGCFRNKMDAKKYKGVTLLQHTEVIPADRILFLAHHEPNPPPSLWWTSKLTDKQHFYHSGTQMAGNKATWGRLYGAYQTTLQGLVERDLFVGDDQPVMQCTCLQHPNLCAYIPHDQVKDNQYFGLRYALHHGGKYDLWYPPALPTRETLEPSLPSARGTRNEPTIVSFKDTPRTTSPNTVVTAYFSLKSKFPSEKYNAWMKHMLSLQDAMVIFTSPNLVEQIQSLRSHAKDKTVILSMPLEHVPLAQEYDATFWQRQLEMDPEKRIHQSHQLFWIWLSKSWFVTEAIRRDFFGSDVYVWSDIGCFRRPAYDGKEMIVHRDQIPRHSILQMAHHKPDPPDTIWWNDKYKQTEHFYHSGSQAAGYKDTWVKFHGEFSETIRGFVERDMFVGEDQTVMQSTCLRHPDLCAYVPFDQVQHDNHYFGLRYVLHHGGTYELWRPPPRPATETE